MYESLNVIHMLSVANMLLRLQTKCFFCYLKLLHTLINTFLHKESHGLLRLGPALNMISEPCSPCLCGADTN